MNILLSHGYFLQEDPKEQVIMKPYPPLGILYLSAWLDKHNLDNQVFDTTFSTKKNLQAYLLAHTPRILALYTNLMTKLNIVDIMRFVRAQENLKNTLIVLGGPDVTHNVEDYLKAGADIVVIGEGEQTMVEIARLAHTAPPRPPIRGRAVNSSVDSTGITSREVTGFLTESTDNSTERSTELFPAPPLMGGLGGAWGSVPGIAVLISGSVHKTAPREKLRDLDELPFPNRQKIDLQLYLDAWKQAHGHNAVSVSTQRGCPYTCRWCSTAVYGQSYRRRSPEAVVDEIEHLQANYDFDLIWFVDDVFTVSHKWLKEFRDALKRRKIRVQFECITRADRLNEEVLQVLKTSGCFRVWIGAESGSQRIIDAMDRRVDVAQVRAMIKAARREGIQAGTFVMLGYPGENEADILETVAHLKDANPDLFTITVAYPIKGTGLYGDVETSLSVAAPWTERTDREIDFQRTYPRRYYDFAVRWTVNSVHLHKQKMAGKQFGRDGLKFWVKASISRAGMWWYRLSSHFITQ